jgi:hypothetical protein
MDDDHHGVLVDHHNCVLDVRRDPRTGVSLVVIHGHRMSDRLDDHLKDDDHHHVLVDHRTNVLDDLKMAVNLDANHVNRNCALPDLMTGVNLDVSRDLRKSDLLGDRPMGGDHRDVLVGHHMNVMGDLKMVLMKCHRVDLPIDPECYVMSHHAK